MKFAKMLLAAVAFFAAAGYPAFASSQQTDQQDTQQTEQQSEPSVDSQSGAADQSGRADNDQAPPPARPMRKSHDHSQNRVVERPPVPEGPRLLIGLEDTLNSKHDKAGRRFIATTLEPVTTAEGEVIPQGVHIRGHIDRVHAAGDTGRARMWLTFDEIQTPRGWRPFVAQLIDAPGVHSIHVLYDREGEIQAASVNRDEAMKAAMVGALAGAAATGMASGKEKETAMAAATAAAQAFMVAYGLGQEFTLEKGMKLELVLERPLHVGRT
ncbi:MAG: hypothetical protein WB723_08540 [Candidatus Acidiferrales bacterium]